LPSVAVSVPGALATPLRTGQPPVVGRAEDGRCLLDLRTVIPDDDEIIIAAVLEAQRKWLPARETGDSRNAPANGTRP
jgi:hypothetical protein